MRNAYSVLKYLAPRFYRGVFLYSKQRDKQPHGQGKLPIYELLAIDYLLLIIDDFD